MKKTTEEALQSEIILHWNKYHFNDGVIFAVANEYSRYRKVPGVLRGVSDLILVLPQGRVLFIELKLPTNKQTPAQVLFQKRVTNLDHQYIVCYSLTQFKEICNSIL